MDKKLTHTFKYPKRYPSHLNVLDTCEDICSLPKLELIKKTSAPGIYSTRVFKVTEPKQKLKWCL